jgi:hypothetical protein
VRDDRTRNRRLLHCQADILLLLLLRYRNLAMFFG